MFDRSDADEFFACAARGDEDGALRRLRILMAAGVDRRVLVDEVVAPALHRAGEAWERNTFDPAAVQRVAVIAQRALDEVGRLRVPARHDRPVLVGCVPGEWHVIAARAVSELLRADGWDARCMESARSGAHVADEARAMNALAVVLSGTLPANLLEFAGTVDAVHLAGVPVVVGGRAFGPDDTRARAVGADGWAATAREASVLLATWARRPVALAPLAGGQFEPALDAGARASVVDAALRVLGRDTSPAGDGVLEAVAPSDLERLLWVAEVARATGDERVLADDVEWFGRYVRARGASSAAAVALDALAGAAPPGAFRSLLLRAAHSPAGDALPRAASF